MDNPVDIGSGDLVPDLCYSRCVANPDNSDNDGRRRGLHLTELLVPAALYGHSEGVGQK